MVDTLTPDHRTEETLYRRHGRGPESTLNLLTKKRYQNYLVEYTWLPETTSLNGVISKSPTQEGPVYLNSGAGPTRRWVHPLGLV